MNQVEQLREIRKVTVAGAILNLILAIIKIIWGSFAGSMALVADGVHSFTDLTTDAAIWIGAKYWTAPPDNNHPYGHGRYETIVNLFIAGIVAFVASGIGWEAIFSIIHGSGKSNPKWYILVIAILSIICKEGLFRWTLTKSKTIGSSALRSNAWHHRSDAFSSFPVAISAIGSYIFPQFNYFDQLASIIVSLMLYKAVWDLSKPSIYEILQTSIDPELSNSVAELAKTLPDVVNIHDVRSHRVGDRIIIDMHMFVDPQMTVYDSHRITQKMQGLIVKEMGYKTNILIHVEPDPDGINK